MGSIKNYIDLNPGFEDFSSYGNLPLYDPVSPSGDKVDYLYPQTVNYSDIGKSGSGTTGPQLTLNPSAGSGGNGQTAFDPRNYIQDSINTWRDQSDKHGYSMYNAGDYVNPYQTVDAMGKPITVYLKTPIGSSSSGGASNGGMGGGSIAKQFWGQGSISLADGGLVMSPEDQFLAAYDDITGPPARDEQPLHETDPRIAEILQGLSPQELKALEDYVYGGKKKIAEPMDVNEIENMLQQMQNRGY